MGDDIDSGQLSMAVCFDFRSTIVVQLRIIGTRTSTVSMPSPIAINEPVQWVINEHFHWFIAILEAF